jgi:serine/threonine protein kinase
MTAQRMRAMPDDTLLEVTVTDTADADVTAEAVDPEAATVQRPAPASPLSATADLRRDIRRCTDCGQQFSPDAMFCPFDGARLETGTWDPSKDSLLGKTIDARYLVTSVLGEGGMGTVYEVRHTTLNRSFAMKVLRRDIARDHELAMRFIQEAKATAAIKHPHIVSITDFGRLDDDTPYFVMELLVGQTLAQSIKRGGPIPTGLAARIARQIAGALGAAHEAGVVHRDLKPENIFLLADRARSAGPEPDVRVVDFGAAKVAGASRLTKAGVVFGTPHYMSPEQASGQPVDHRSDIYALGVIMYEMFTGRVPFEADTYMGVLTQHMFVHPTPPSQLTSNANPSLGALEEITLRALEKAPEQRYQAMQSLGADLDRAVRFSSDGAVFVEPTLGLVVGDNVSSGHLLSEPGVDSPLGGSLPPAWRLPAMVGGAFAAVVLLLITLNPWRPSPDKLADRSALAQTAASVAAPVIPPPETPPETAAPPAVRLVSSPPFAEVWQEQTRIGTTPVDITPGTKPARYTLRSPGYVDREVVLDADHGPEFRVDLQKQKPPSGGVHAGSADGKPAHRSVLGDLGDPWATKP